MAPPTQVEVSITSTSQVMDFDNFPPIALPKITLNGNPFPAPQGPNSRIPCGFQVAVIDSTKDMTDPASIITNEAASVPIDQDNLWATTYQGLYDWIASDILTSGDVQNQLVFVASFGLDANMPPTPEALEQLIQRGAGRQIQEWVTSVDPGSMGGDFISYPANYILIGNSAYGYGEGTEMYDSGSSPITSTAMATLDNPV
jgi:hypothetical protein